MYCPSCGIETTAGLNYCNRCGMNLSVIGAPTEIVQVSLTKPAVLLGILMMFLTLGGFTLLIMGARLLASSVQRDDPIVALIFLGMVTILTVDIFLARQLTKLVNAALRFDSPKKTNTAQFSPPPNAQQLPRANTAPFVPASSVTENTTRFLEETYRPPSESVKK